MPWWRPAAGWGLVAVLAVALAVTLWRIADDRASAPAAFDPPAPVATAAPSPTPTASPTPPGLVLDGGERPEVDLTGEDFDRIVRDLQRLSTWLGRNPNPDSLHLVWDPQGPEYALFEEQHREAAEKGWRDASEDPRILSVDVLDRPNQDMVVLRVVETNGPQYIVDDNGDVVQELDGYRAATIVRILKRSASGEWRLWQSHLETIE